MYSSPTPGTGVFQPLAALTLQSGGSAPAINIDRIVQVEDYNSGSRVHWLTENGTVSSFDVDETPTEIAAVVPLVNLTLQLYLVNDSSTLDIWVLADCISDPFDLASGARVTLLTSIQGFSKVVDVTQSAADIIAAQAAASMIPGSGTWGNLTATGANQGGAAAIVTNNVRITGGAAGTGVRLTAGTVGEKVVIKNTTASGKFIYPATGEFIDERGANQAFAIPAYGQIELECGLAGRWTTFRDTCVAAVDGNLTVQLTATKILPGTDVAVLNVSFGNTAVQLPQGSINARIRVVNPSATTARLFPFTGDEIGSLGANNVLLVPPNTGVDLLFNDPALSSVWTVVSGTVTPAQYVSSIRPVTPTTAVSFSDGGTAIASFSTGGITHSVGTAFAFETGVPTPGGNQSDGVQVNHTHFLATSCATLGDSLTMSGQSTISSIRNAGVADAYCYCPNGHTMNGVTDGFARVPAGKTIVVVNVADSAWVSSELVNEIVTTVTLVAGQGVVQSAAGAGAVAIGALVSQITAASYVEVLGVTALNGTPALSVNFISTAVAATTLTIVGYDATGVAAATDVSTVRIRIVF